jgi:hypothetical protein
MENFFNYITQPLKSEDVDIWFRVNNIISEKLDLFSDFTKGLNFIVVDTYLGNQNVSNETKIKYSSIDDENHFKWCWNKNIENFKKENLFFEFEGEHYDYYKSFFQEIFYTQNDQRVRESVEKFFKELFDMKKSFTKSDLDMISTIYKSLDKNLKKI